MHKNKPLESYQAFLNHLHTSYKAMPWEKLPEDNRHFLPDIGYADLCTKRTFWLCRELAALKEHEPTVLDIGIYPGVQARLLKALLPFKFHLFGAGLCLNSEFLKSMNESVETFLEIDLDPFYSHSNTPPTIDLADKSLNAIYALEIIEHLITPLPFLKEAQRLLKPGGLLIISTPNVSHAGGIISLMRGRSNYEDLDKSPMYSPDSEWRGHIRTYAKYELLELAARHGFSCKWHRYYREPMGNKRQWSWSGRLYYFFRSFLGAIIPSLREDQIAVFVKD